MIYKVELDGIDIYKPEDPCLGLISGEVTLEANTVGSFDFVMPPEHIFYDNIVVLKNEIKVYEDGSLIFKGRPIEVKTDWYNRKTVHCEGALAYLNDYMIRPAEFNNEGQTKWTIIDFFKEVIKRYNEIAPDSKKIKIGEISVENRQNIIREIDYETAWDVITNKCIDTDYGYVFARYESDGTYIDWLKDMPYDAGQEITFSINLVDLSKNINGSEIFTVLIPLGDDIDDKSESKVGKRLTLITPDNNKDYIDIDYLISQYGRIERVVEFEGVKTVDDLRNQANKYIEDFIKDFIVLEVNAVDLHYIEDESDINPKFRLGQTVHVTSTPHDVNVDLPLIKISMNIVNPNKTITIGTKTRDSISTYVNPYRE